MRLDKFICKSTTLTKAEAIDRIYSGDVIVNDRIVVVERTQVHEDNHIILDGLRLQLRPFRYLMVHKPAENTSELHVAGRLDADTTGLVLVTDDGRWSFDIIRPSLACEKVYRVKLSQAINADAIARLKLGVQLQGESNLTLPAKLVVVGPKEVLLTIIEGKYHQVKRMFAAVGNRVITLHRERVGALMIDIEQGQWRYAAHIQRVLLQWWSNFGCGGLPQLCPVG